MENFIMPLPTFLEKKQHMHSFPVDIFCDWRGRGDLLEDLERRCFNVQKDYWRLAWLILLAQVQALNAEIDPFHLLPQDLSLQHLPEVPVTELVA